MGAFLWLKSRQKIGLGLLVAIAIPPLIAFMPEQWSQRMDTINTYEEDESVNGRFNAWGMAFNLTKDRPLIGGGFEIATRELFTRYAPDIMDDPRAAHSNYFQALGEHGYVGLGLYLLFALLTWRTGTWIIRNTANLKEYRWARDLAAMIQVSLIGFAVGGAFLSLLYFDVPYYLVAAMVATRILVEKDLKEKAALAVIEKRTGAQHQFGNLNPSQSQRIAGGSG
jgi:probable O-glycosylation ligase (exosortase A-associated)